MEKDQCRDCCYLVERDDKSWGCDHFDKPIKDVNYNLGCPAHPAE